MAWSSFEFLWLFESPCRANRGAPCPSAARRRRRSPRRSAPRACARCSRRRSRRALASFGEEEMRLCFQKLLRDRPDGSSSGRCSSGARRSCSRLRPGRPRAPLRRGARASAASARSCCCSSSSCATRTASPDLAAERVVEPLPADVSARDALTALRVAAKEREKARLVAAAEAQERENDALEREARAHAAQTDVGRHPAVAELRDAVKQAHARIGSEPGDG